MALPNYYVQVGEQAIASYDFYDLATRIGYKKFYGCAQYNSSDTASTAPAAMTNSTAYFLAVDTVQSDPIYTPHTGTPLNGTWSNAIDIDFDLIFSNPQIISGDAFINATVQVTDAGLNGDLYVTTKYFIRHYDGSTETDLGSGFGRYEYTNETTEVHRDCVKINIPLTKFKVGDRLRVTAQVIWASNHATPNDKSCLIYHDPANRMETGSVDLPTGAKADTDFVVYVPFKIDL